MFLEEIKISVEKALRTNRQIRSRQVRLIGASGEQIGIVKIEEAIRMAEEASLDLVEISPNSEPPVCRVMDHGKFQFQQNKKRTAAKKKQKQILIKELKFRPGIEEGDYQVKLRKLVEFLAEGNKVKVTIKFRGREVSHSEIAFKLLERLQVEIAEHGIVEQTPKFEGSKQVVMVIASKKKP